MFGVGDNNQNSNGSSLPPSPFMSDQPAMGDQPASSVPVVPAPESVVHSPTTVDDHVAATTTTHVAGPSDDLLVGIKQQALSNLTPLVGHLDQTPEERFKTTMMLIQASDNSGLVKDAYEAASQIADEKTRAQALLDVVNEINYFTQKDSTDEHKT